MLDKNSQCDYALPDTHSFFTAATVDTMSRFAGHYGGKTGMTARALTGRVAPRCMGVCGQQ